MAATRVLSGVAREVWNEAAYQVGGAVQPVTTGIRVTKASDVSRVRVLVQLTHVIGAPVITAAVTIGAGNLLVLTVANTAGGGATNEARWRADIQLLHTIQQKNDGTAGAEVIVLAPSGQVLWHAQTHWPAHPDDITRPTVLANVFPFAVAWDHDVIRADDGGAAGVVVQLPVEALSPNGYKVTVVKVAGAGSVNVTPFGGELINGLAAPVVLAGVGDSVTLVATNVGWWVVAATP